MKRVDFLVSRRKVNALFDKLTTEMTRREFLFSSSALVACGCRTSDASDTLRTEMRRCIDTGLYSGLAVDPERDFAGGVLGGQIAGKAKTMDVRVNLLRMMA